MSLMGLILKDMNPCFLSSDAHTPMSPMRTTQTNIGLQLVKEDASSERYGVSKEQYGGVGPKYFKDPRYLNAPRTMWHVRTGVHGDIPPIVSPHNRDLIVMNNKTMFASPVTEVGADVYDLWCKQFENRRARKVERSLFPRSIVWELEYIKNENHKVMLAALERERQAFEEKKMRKRDQANQNQIDQDAKKIGQKREVDACETAPPFWWDDASGRPIQPGPEPQTGDFLYTTNPSDVAVETPDVVREMELDSSQGYIPGEIYKGAKVPVQVKKKDCPIAQWSPRGVDFQKTFDHSQVQGNLNGSKFETPAAGNSSLSRDRSGGQTLFEDSAHLNCCQPLGCQCHNELVHRHLGRVATSTPLRPVIPHEKEEAAEVTAGGCMSVSGICGCESFKQGQRVKINKPKLIEHDFPGSEIKYTPYGEQERQDELFKVGVPFRTQAAKWMDANKDPLPPRPPPKQTSPWRE
uniref:Tubby-related protein 2 n=2 Tax=Lygus hesperus TaxID=30085 RepID=A0A0A9W963_LYGHE